MNLTMVETTNRAVTAIVSDPEDLKIIFKSLTDTLIQYTKADLLIQASTVFESRRNEFISPEEDLQGADFYQWIGEDESEKAELILELRQAIIAQTENVSAENKKELDTISFFLKGGFLMELSKQEVTDLCDFLCKRKYIPETAYTEFANLVHVHTGCHGPKVLREWLLNKVLKQHTKLRKLLKQVLTAENAYTMCLNLLSVIRPRKPDWPFDFIDKLNSMRSLQDTDCEKTQEFNQQQVPQPQVLSDSVAPSTASTASNQSSSFYVETPAELSYTDSTNHGDSSNEQFPSDVAGNKIQSSFSVQDQDGALKSSVGGYGLEPTIDETEPKLFLQEASKCLDTVSKLSFEFSELEGVNDELEKQEMEHMTDFSDESSDDESVDPRDTVSTDLQLRNYQKELAENALKGHNTIICAPTGSGKTRVATHIILQHLQGQEDHMPKRKVAFLARTVPLVMQQFKSFKKYLKGFQIENLTGESEHSMSLHKLISSYDIFVMTPRILENHVKRKKPLLPDGLSAFSLLVFDECHHTRKGEAYCTLMLTYLRQKNEKTLPQIVGLTASLGIEKAKDDKEAKKNILKICSNLDAESISLVKSKENVEELQKLVPVPSEEIIRLCEMDESQAVKTILEAMADIERNVAERIKEVNDEILLKIFNKMPARDKRGQKYGNWLVTMAKEANTIKGRGDEDKVTSLRALVIFARHLRTYNVALESFDLIQLEDVIEYLRKNLSVDSDSAKKLTKAEEACNNLFRCLLKDLQEILKDSKEKENRNLVILKRTIRKNLFPKRDAPSSHTISHTDQALRGIVFVKTRALAHALVSWLGRKQSALGSLRAAVFTGTAATEDEGGMTEAMQEEVIDAFKSGKSRLLFATSVGEEGLDIPECNLVIKYNHVGNEVTTVQTRGRSRRKGGKSILLAFDDIYKKELINQHDAKVMERAIRAVSEMTTEEIVKQNMTSQNEIIIEDRINRSTRKRDKNEGKTKQIFKMICKHCRKVEISNEDIRVLDESHHIVINRDVFDKVRKKRYEVRKVWDQQTVFAAAFCYGEPEKGKVCGKKLGSVMIFRRIPFVVPSIEQFMIDLPEKTRMESYRSWKLVPYHTGELDWSQDIKRYRPELHDSSDDESDDDGNGDTGGRPVQKNTQNADAVAAPLLVSSPAIRPLGRDSGFQSESGRGKTAGGDRSHTEIKAVALDTQSFDVEGACETGSTTDVKAVGFSDPTPMPMTPESHRPIQVDIITPGDSQWETFSHVSSFKRPVTTIDECESVCNPEVSDSDDEDNQSD